MIDYIVTSANVHDSKALPQLVDASDKALYADSVYSGNALQEGLPGTVECRIHEKGYRGPPLTEEQKARIGRSQRYGRGLNTFWAI